MIVCSSLRSIVTRMPNSSINPRRAVKLESANSNLSLIFSANSWMLRICAVVISCAARWAANSARSSSSRSSVDSSRALRSVSRSFAKLPERYRSISFSSWARFSAIKSSATFSRVQRGSFSLSRSACISRMPTINFSGSKNRDLTQAQTAASTSFARACLWSHFLTVAPRFVEH